MGQEDRMSFAPSLDVAPAPFVSATATSLGLAPTSGLVSHDARSPQRAALEEFVRREFRVHFGARIRHFMPELLGLHGPDGSIRAVVGCHRVWPDRCSSDLR
jgi:hypothetical protein